MKICIFGMNLTSLILAKAMINNGFIVDVIGSTQKKRNLSTRTIGVSKSNLDFINNHIINIKPKFAIKHPNWRMGKKISIDSSNMMNKVFEYIEAKKIFNLKNDKLSILIHPSSFVHAIVYFKGNLIKFFSDLVG